MPSRDEASPNPNVYARRTPENTILYDTIRGEIETFLARAEAAGRTVPKFVERELRAFLQCGILAHGFVHVHCDGCGHDRLVALSCKGRGFCPSCGGRRMAETAAFLVDHVLPHVPVRQWVLSLPIALRYRLGCDSKLTAEVLRLFIRTVADVQVDAIEQRARRAAPVPRDLRRRAPALIGRVAEPAAVTSPLPFCRAKAAQTAPKQFKRAREKRPCWDVVTSTSVRFLRPSPPLPRARGPPKQSRAATHGPQTRA